MLEVRCDKLIWTKKLLPPYKMADSYVKYLLKGELNKVEMNKRVGRQFDGMPFTLAREASIEVTVRTIMKTHKVTPEMFKQIVFAYANDKDIYFPDETYDEWYDYYMTTHPFLFTQMFPERDIMLNNPENVVEQLFNEEQNFKERETPQPMETDEEDDNLIADINDDNQVIFRKKTAKDKVQLLYGNWLFNYLGFPSGIVIGQVVEYNLKQHMNVLLKRLENDLADPFISNANPCSFIQEVLSGHRIHEDHVFPFTGIEAANVEAGATCKAYLRRAYEAKGSMIPSLDTITYPFTKDALNVIEKLTSNFHSKLVVPYDPRPMKLMEYPMDQIFQVSDAETELYRLNDVYKYYLAECPRLNFRPAQNVSQFAMILKRQMGVTTINRKKVYYIQKLRPIRPGAFNFESVNIDEN